VSPLWSASPTTEAPAGDFALISEYFHQAIYGWHLQHFAPMMHGVEPGIASSNIDLQVMVTLLAMHSETC